jgi:protein ImuB
MTRQILSLWLPRLASDLAQRRLGEANAPLAAPLAIIARQGRGDVLACVNPPAQAAGLRAGQALSDARALVPGLITRPQDLAAQARALAGLRRWALRYAPWVAVDGTEGLVIDLTGSTHLMGGAQALAQDLHARLDALRLDARLGVAPTRGAAWALARFGPAPLALTEDAPSAMAALPLAALRLPEDTVQGLSRLGMRVVRDLACAPRAALARRFGADLMLRLDQALGAVAEPVAPPAQDPVHAVRLSLPEPIGLTRDVMAGLDRLLARLEGNPTGATLAAMEARLQEISTAILLAHGLTEEESESLFEEQAELINRIGRAEDDSADDFADMRRESAYGKGL